MKRKSPYELLSIDETLIISFLCFEKVVVEMELCENSALHIAIS